MDNLKNIIKVNNNDIEYFMDYRMYYLLYVNEPIKKKNKKWYNIFNF